MVALTAWTTVYIRPFQTRMSASVTNPIFTTKTNIQKPKTPSRDAVAPQSTSVTSVPARRAVRPRKSSAPTYESIMAGSTVSLSSLTLPADHVLDHLRSFGRQYSDLIWKCATTPIPATTSTQNLGRDWSVVLCAIASSSNPGTYICTTAITTLAAYVSTI